MKKLLTPLLITLLYSCNQSTYKSKLADTDSLGGMTVAELRAKIKDSLNKEITKSVYMNFTEEDLAKSPVKILTAKPVEKSYSSYKDIRLTYKNVSDKTISAIRFMWTGINAFGEPADMGTVELYSEGIGGGFTDDRLRPGKTDYAVWSILSMDLKKVTKAWAYEVVFEDGSKWKLKE